MDDRLIVYMLYLGWAVACVVAWGKVLRDAIGTYHRWRDRRAKRELVVDIGLFTVALACFVSLIVLTFGQEVSGARGFALAVALGSFLAVGIIQATLGRRRGRMW